MTIPVVLEIYTVIFEAKAAEVKIVKIAVSNYVA